MRGIACSEPLTRVAMPRLQIKKSSHYNLLPWLFLAVGLAATLFLWNEERKNLRNLAEQNFLSITNQATEKLNRHFDDYRNHLRSAHGLIVVAGDITPRQWRDFYETAITTKSFLHVDGISFTRLVSKDRLDALTTLMRWQRPDFKVFPKSDNADNFVITLIEPMERTARAVGFDIGTSPQRREAAELARDNGRVEMSQIIDLITTKGKHRDIILFQPVYHQPAPPSTRAERRRDLRGWVTLGVNIDSLFQSLFKPDDKTVYLEVFDVTDPKQSMNIYSTGAVDDGISQPSRTTFRHENILTIGTRSWQVVYSSTGVFDKLYKTGGTYLGLVAGVIMSLALWLAARLLITSRQQALTIAEEITEALKSSEERFRDLTTASADWFWETDKDGRFSIMSPRVRDIIGLEPDYCVGKTRRQLVEVHTTKNCQNNYEQWERLDKCIQARQPFSNIIQEWIRPDNGKIVICINNGQPFFDDKGQWQGYRGTCRDITTRIVADDALRESEEKYRTIINSTSQGYLLIGPDRLTIEVNQALCDMMEMEKEDFVGKSLLDFVAPGEEKVLKAQVNKSSMEHHTHFELDLITKVGDTITTRVDSTVLRKKDGTLIYAFAFIADITEIKLAEKRIQHMATHDVLTDLPSRNLFTDRLEQAIARSRRDGTLQAVMFLDLDGFKLVNDKMGHQTGDDVLRMVAGRLLNSVRETDTVARHGGDEFTILLTSVRDHKMIAQIAEKIITAVSEPYPLGHTQANLGVSIGIATCQGQEGKDADTIMHDADEAMYRAKNNGGKCFEFSENGDPHAP